MDDMLIESEQKLNYWDVIIKPKRSSLVSRSNVDLKRQFIFKNGSEITGIPIVAANMSTGTPTMAMKLAEYKMFTAIAKHHMPFWFEKYPLDDQIAESAFYTIGMNSNDLMGFARIYAQLIDSSPKLCIDIANGYTQEFSNFVSLAREKYPKAIIVAGNVATPEMTEQLIIAGAYIVKVGISAGSVCETRLKTAVGYPQLSAVIECADAAHGLNGYIMADGGIRNPGDIARAFCANADFVMIGGMFAGTYEADGEVITRHFKTGEMKFLYEENGKKYYEDIVEERYVKIFYGMSSEYAQKKHMGEMKEYRTSEGAVNEVPYVGGVENVVKDILGGLRSTGTYIGASSIKHFGKCATFVKTSKVHDKF